jgi:phage gp29-like protein
MADDYRPIIDQFGAVIPRAEIAQLKQQVASPSSFSTRPPFAGHLAFGIDPGRLGMILRGADNFNSRDWFTLAEEMEELFPHYTAVLSKRKRQVALLPITVEDAKTGKDAKRHGDFLRAWLDKEILQHALYDAMDAVGKGFTANEIIWESAPGRVQPAEILWRHQRDFEVSWEDGETLLLRDNAGFTPLARHKFWLHGHKVKSGGVARSGISRIIAWMWMYSSYTLKDWALFVQGYGLPVRLGRYGAEASSDDKRTLWRAVRSIGGDLAAIIPKSMEMEFVEAKGANDGSRLYSERMNWLDQQASKLVLGGTAGMDAISGGHAVGKEHRAGEQDVEKFDAMMLAGSFNRQIGPAMIAFTFGPQDAYPRIKIGTEEQVPLSDVIASVADLGPLGFKAKASELRDRLQLTEPGPHDEVIGPPPAPAPGQVDEDGNPLVKADLKPKANPHPEINPNSDERALMTARPLFGRFTALQTAQKKALDTLIDRVETEAGKALGGMTDQVRDCFEASTSMDDLAVRLEHLKLDSHAFQTAMMQGMALANLVGQAELLDEITGLPGFHKS